MRECARAELSPILLVTSAGRVLVVAGREADRVFYGLPLVPGRAADAVAWLREMLAAEISGLRLVGTFQTSAGATGRLLAARVVGRAPGHWQLNLPEQGASGAVIEVTLPELVSLCTLSPEGVAPAVRETLDGPAPLEVLIGPYAADVPS